MVEVPLSSEALLTAPVLEWEPGPDRPKMDGCVRSDGAGGLLISNGFRIVLLREDGSHERVIEASAQEHRVLGTLPAADGSDRQALAIYEPEAGRLLRVDLPLGEAPAPELPRTIGLDAALPPPALLMSLAEPWPRPQALLLHGRQEGVVMARSRTHLQLVEPGPDRQQKVKMEVKAGMGGCPHFSVSLSALWSSGAVEPETGDVYFLDSSGACLYRWDTSPAAPAAARVTRVASWDVQTDADEDPRLHAVDRLAMGSGFLLAWGGRGRSFRLLRIDLGCFAVSTLDLLSPSGALFRRPKFHREMLRLSGDLLYMVVFKSEQPHGTIGRLERLYATDLALDESAPCISELHDIDWSSPGQLVSFRLRRGPEAAGTPPPSLLASLGSDDDPCCEVLSVDRRVLCARSEYFRAMFGCEMREACAGVVELREVGAPAFRCLVDYLHTDLINPVKSAGYPGHSLDGLSPMALLDCGLLCLDVAQLADRYQLLRLRRLAEVFVYEHALHIPTVLSLLARAHSLGLEDVVEACLRVVAKNWVDIKSSYRKELERFVVSEPAVATAMLLRCPTMSLR